MKRFLSVLAPNSLKSNKKSTRLLSSSSANSEGSDNYDVFLSFSGKDTRKTFVDHLYNGLIDAGIRVFRDDDELRKGENIGTNLLQAIKNSKISTPILSRNYASSKWCLQELVQMAECMKSIGHVVLPIFYRVEPTHVRHQKGSFGVAFSQLSEKHPEEDVAKWKQALQEVASLKGWESKKTAHGHEGELVKMVVRKVLTELKKAFRLVVTEQLVGIDDAVEDILRLLDDNPSATQTIGIYGMGGIGKTTLAKVIYNKLSDQFQHRCFLENIRKSSTSHDGILYLQNQLIYSILKKNNQACNMDEAIRIIESRFKRKKVLILLDDVDHKDQIEALVGKHDSFEMGSRIIITTRVRSVLDNAGVNCKYELKEIAEDKSLILFSRHAFMSDSPPCEFETLSRAVVSTTGGLPLALEVIGSFLCGRNQAFWEDALKKLKKVPHTKVQDKLRISYEALNYEEKQIFLDIACFFIDVDYMYVSYMWEACNFLPNMGIETLSFMSLLKIEDKGVLKMHDQLRDLGREIVRQEDYDVPMNRSRLWDHDEALEVLQNTKGIQKDRIQALGLPGDCSQSEFTTEQFETLPNLRLLAVNGAKLIGDSKRLLPKLRYLTWFGCPASVATSFHLEKLVALELSDSDISELWEGWSRLKVAKQLKALSINDCHCLKVTLDLSAFRNLEVLSFEGCDNLEQIHHSIGEAKGLVYLDLCRCEKLKELPQEMGKLEELKELHVAGTAVKEIPPCIGSLKKLEILNAADCHSLVGLPNSISHLVNLLTLHLSDCPRLCALPESIGSLVKLEHLMLGGLRLLKDYHFDHAPNYILNSIGEFEQSIALDLSCSGIRELPESIGDLKNLRRLHIDFNKELKSLPSTISKLGNLEELDATKCESLGGEIHIDGLSSLKILRLRSTCVSGFPNEFDKLSFLEELDLRDCKMLQSLPQSISKLPSLQCLDVRRSDNLRLLPELPACLTFLGVTCRHHTLPQLSHLILLKVLVVVGCQLLASLPELPSGILELFVQDCDQLKELRSLSNLEFLSKLTIDSCSELTEIKGLEALKYLAELSISRCGKLSNLDGLEHLESLRSLSLGRFSASDDALCPVEDDIVQVRGLDKLKNLEELRLGDCQSLVRPDLSQLTHLKILYFYNCHNLVEIKGLRRLKNLEKLGIVGCGSIETLPDLSCFDNLKHLDITGCSKLGHVQGLEKVAEVYK
ncbi:disease resistance protein L6-like [Rhodamnia argentea]|uniref:Disease resistance protein L6-like n=1 Tax=Rhodamnia argentea TaxID=178133 RepID=A0ABM3HXW6_9MYRT|nr:disease resistance protein L6-like [Rhodamnia argentea]